MTSHRGGGGGVGWERVKNFVVVSCAGCEVTAVTLHDAAGRFRRRHRMFPVTSPVELEPTSFITKTILTRNKLVLLLSCCQQLLYTLEISCSELKPGLTTARPQSLAFEYRVEA